MLFAEFLLLKITNIPPYRFTYRWTLWKKHRYTFNHRKWIELQISHRWYYLYDWRGVIATIVTATIDIIYNAEWVNRNLTWVHFVQLLSLPLRLSTILLCILAWILHVVFLLPYSTAIYQYNFQAPISKLKRGINEAKRNRAHSEINLPVSLLSSI